MTRLDEAFDSLARALAAPVDRRRALRFLGAGAASAAAPWWLRVSAAKADCGPNGGTPCGAPGHCTGASACGFTNTDAFGCLTCNLQCCYGGTYARTATVCCDGVNSAGQPAKWCCGPSAPICGRIARECLRDCKRRCGGDCCEDDELCCGNSRETGYCCSVEEATEDSKRICEKYARRWDQEAEDNLGLAVPLYVLSPPASVIALTTALVDQIAAEGLFRAADDPPDQNFARVVTPAVRKLPRLKPAGGLDKAAVRAIQALLDNQATAAAMLGAWVTSLERSQGAALAEDRAAAEMQVRAAAKFAKAAADGYAKEAVLRVKALKATKGQLGGLRATAAQAEKARSLARRGRLPPGLPTKLTSIGFTAAQQEDLRKRIASASAANLTRAYSLSGLGSSDSLALAKNLERELRAYATRASTTPLARSR
jgi:hypothetical protein